jgi:hypothetical protein
VFGDLGFGLWDGGLPGAVGLEGCVHRAACQAPRCIFRARGRHCGVWGNETIRNRGLDGRSGASDHAEFEFSMLQDLSLPMSCSECTKSWRVWFAYRPLAMMPDERKWQELGATSAFYESQTSKPVGSMAIRTLTISAPKRVIRDVGVWGLGFRCD